jgi:hypothetical protein
MGIIILARIKIKITFFPLARNLAAENAARVQIKSAPITPPEVLIRELKKVLSTEAFFQAFL